MVRDLTEQDVHITSFQKGAFRSCITQTSLWKRSLLLLFSIGWLVLEVSAFSMGLLSLVPPPVSAVQACFVQKKWGSLVLETTEALVSPVHPPPCSHYLLVEYSRLPPQGPIRNTRVQPRGDSGRQVLWNVGCTHPLWGVSSGPGTGRWSGSDASGHLWSESKSYIMSHNVKDKIKSKGPFSHLPLVESSSADSFDVWRWFWIQWRLIWNMICFTFKKLISDLSFHKQCPSHSEQTIV